MDVFLQVVVVALYVFLVTLIARVVIDLVQLFARDYRPGGMALILFEFIYTVTDPPIRALRRFIPPLQLGGVRLDLALLVLFIGVQIVIFLVQSLRFA
jgi:YggT family protein